MFAIYKILNPDIDTFDINNLELIKKCNSIKEWSPRTWHINKYFLLQNGWSFIMNRHIDSKPNILMIDIESSKIDKKIYQIIRDLKLEELLD